MTREDIISEIARELELLGAGQEIDQDLKTAIDSVYAMRWGLLAKKGLAYFPMDNVPLEASGPLVTYMAGYAAQRVLDAQGKAEKMALVQSAENDLRILAGDKTNNKTTPPLYF